MNFLSTEIDGAFVVELEPVGDHRGCFARVWSSRTFGERGLETRFAEWNMSRTAKKGTIRGLHWQEEPHAETKLLRCTRGAVQVVIVDLRADSPTRYRWCGVELRSDSFRLLYTPAGCAHGFQTLEDDSEVFYAVSSCYAAEAERGLRWDDPRFGIQWPLAGEVTVSEKDSSWPDFSDHDHH